MPSQGCFDNIKKETPPIYCDNIDIGGGKKAEVCSKIQGPINKFCERHTKGVDTPVPQFTQWGQCYCCCSCFAYGTPIEVQPDLYKLIENIKLNETVLATGPDVSKWTPRPVTELGGIAPGSQVDFMWHAQFRMADGTLRQLIASEDHLFLRPPDGGPVLIPLQDLRPGDHVRQSDGKDATVEFTTPMQFSGGVRHIALGPYKAGESLDGHLLNSNGLVTADLSVQLVHYGGSLAPEIVGSSAAPKVGSPKFFVQYDTRAYSEFLANPKLWPPGGQPCSHPLINIPAGAFAYFTDQQAQDIEEKIGDQDLGNSAPMALIHYLFNVYRGFYSKVFYIIDWGRLTPNAWYFGTYDQKYIVISGGLVRVPQLSRSGLAIVLTNLIARSEGYLCNAVADYQGTADVLRNVWINELFFQTFTVGLKEVRATFDLIDPDHRGEDPEDVCRIPSIQCRERALAAGGAFEPLPTCAEPGPAFAVTGAEAKGSEKVVVRFNQPINVPSSTNPENYAISDEALVIGVKPKGENVSLKVENLQSGNEYTVTVSNVYSASGHPLTPGHHTATFKID